MDNLISPESAPHNLGVLPVNLPESIHAASLLESNAQADLHASTQADIHANLHASSQGNLKKTPTVQPSPYLQVPIDDGGDWGGGGYDSDANATCYFADSFLDPQPNVPETVTPDNPVATPQPDATQNPVEVIVIYGHKQIPSWDGLPAVSIPDNCLNYMSYVVDGQISTPCANGTPGNKIDLNFISVHEGNKPYMTVPNQYGVVKDDSGPTIAAGFDLGHKTVTGLQKLNLPAGLISELTPYLGHHGQEALTFVNAHPLTITSAEVALINSASFADSMARTATTYDNGVGKTGAFYSLPTEAQTALADFAYNFGSLDRFPNFWSQITHEDWSGAIQNLRTWDPNALPGNIQRRNDEADLLQSALNSNKIQNGVLC